MARQYPHASASFLRSQIVETTGAIVAAATELERLKKQDADLREALARETRIAER